MKRADLIKNISLGLIYPAILGSMIFIFMQFISDTKTIMISRDYSFKMFVLISAIIIYLIDYIKRSLILNYKFWMLFFDFTIVYNLFFLIYSSNIINSIGEPIGHKALFNISLTYIILAGYNSIFLFVTKLKSYNKEISEHRHFNKEIIIILFMYFTGFFLIIALHWQFFSDEIWKFLFVIISVLMIISEAISLIFNIRLKTIK